MKLKSTTKMAIQAALAIAIAEVVSALLSLERGYWIPLTAMALTMQTWGESIKRALERVSMTIIGGLVGTGLYFLLPANQWLIITLLLIFVFLTLYLLPIVYLAAVFFLTCFVVFLFALIGEWTVTILMARIVETILGAGIALMVGAGFFPLRTNINHLLIQFCEKIYQQIDQIFTQEPGLHRQTLQHECQQLRKAALAVRYELLFHRISQQEFYALLNQALLCAQYVIHLQDAYHLLVPQLSKKDLVDIRIMRQTTRYNIKVLIQFLRTEQPVKMLAITRASELLEHAIERQPARFMHLDHEGFGFFNLMYFFARLNSGLHAIQQILHRNLIGVEA